MVERAVTSSLPKLAATLLAAASATLLSGCAGSTEAAAASKPPTFSPGANVSISDLEAAVNRAGLSCQSPTKHQGLPLTKESVDCDGVTLMTFADSTTASGQSDALSGFIGPSMKLAYLDGGLWAVYGETAKVQKVQGAIGGKLYGA